MPEASWRSACDAAHTTRLAEIETLPGGAARRRCSATACTSVVRRRARRDAAAIERLRCQARAFASSGRADHASLEDVFVSLIEARRPRTAGGAGGWRRHELAHVRVLRDRPKGVPARAAGPAQPGHGRCLMPLIMLVLFGYALTFDVGPCTPGGLGPGPDAGEPRLVRRFRRPATSPWWPASAAATTLERRSTPGEACWRW